jgi:hypothetical protein
MLGRCAIRQKSTFNSTRWDIVTRPAIFERLAHYLQHISLKLGQLVEEQHAVVPQRNFAGTRHGTASDQSGVTDGVVR